MNWEVELMKSPIISFGLFWNNVKRFWPLWLTFFACWVLGFLLPLGVVPLNYPSDSAAVMEKVWEIEFYGSWFGSLIGAVVSCVLAFEYLFKQTSAMFYGSLPIKRQTVFVTVFLTGLLPLLAVEVIVFVCAFLISGSGIHAINWFAATAMCTFVFYSLATFCAQLTGNRIVAVALTFVLNFVVVSAELLIRVFASSMIYGLSFIKGGLFLEWASPAVEILHKCFIQGHGIVAWFPLGMYCIAALLFVIFAALLNRVRHLESASNAVAAKGVNPVFKYLAAFCWALFFGQIAFVAFSFGADFSAACMVVLCIFMIIGGFGGLLFAEMAISKSTRVFGKCWKGGLVITLACIVFVAGCAFDVLGIGRYVPSAQDVRNVTLSIDGYDSVIDDDSTIQDFVDAHEDFIKAGTPEVSDEAEANFSTLSVAYELVDGTHIYREYDIYSRSDNQNKESVQAAEEVFDVFNSPDGIESRWKAFFDASKLKMGISVYYAADKNGETRELELSRNEQQDFIDHALKPDLLKHGAAQYDPLDESRFMAYSTDIAAFVSFQPYDESSGTQQLDYEISKKHTPNTIKWFKEHYQIDLAKLPS